MKKHLYLVDVSALDADMIVTPDFTSADDLIRYLLAETVGTSIEVILQIEGKQWIVSIDEVTAENKRRLNSPEN